MLQLEYLDLYLIHWPLSAKPGKIEFPVPKEEQLAMDFKSVWAAMEDCQRFGLTKSIGVSNFSCKKLENILSLATIPPSVNQVSLSHFLLYSFFLSILFISFFINKQLFGHCCKNRSRRP